ncbi:CHAT domain-containing protein [Streptomyces sp. NBC_00328]|uniref:CHAT domain-containing protein n=1 Tax=Streptomyces sp. NBC_00328 TaxID=2903646 RepID=UPI002E2C5E27|nr:CHAT domain-containing protein [Streptomyces sp. NBC_00328]
MSELHNRVLARLLTARKTDSPAPLRVPEAVEEAFALLCRAAPWPEAAINLEVVHAVLWTFHLRHLGPSDPDAALNTAVVSAAFGFLYPRAPEHMVLPAVAVEDADAAPLVEARFAQLVADAHHSAASEPWSGDAGQMAALQRALAWSAQARRLLPLELAPNAELELKALEIELTRFELDADPDALARAARHGQVVCDVLSASGPERMDPDVAETAAIALSTMVHAAQVLGRPPLNEVDRMIDAMPSGPLPPETRDLLSAVRWLEGYATSWTGQFDLQMGLMSTRIGMLNHHAGWIAGAVRRLRAALDATPVGHPSRIAVISALADALEAFAHERGDAAAAREAADLRAQEPGADATRHYGLDFLTRLGLADDFDFPDADLFLDVDAFLDSGDFLDDPATLEEHAGGQRETLQIGGELAELLDSMVAWVKSSGDPLEYAVSEQQIGRFRSALGAVPADDPRRHLYVAVLAGLVGTRACELRTSEPGRAAELQAEADSLAAETAAIAPPDLTLTGFLADGHYRIALQIAVVDAVNCEPDGTVDDPELALSATLLSKYAGLQPDDPASDHNIAIMREAMGLIPEDDTVRRAYLSEDLGAVLRDRFGSTGDPATGNEAAALLRYAHAHSPESSALTDFLLAQTLTLISMDRSDPAAAREAAAVLAEATARDASAAKTQEDDGAEAEDPGHEVRKAVLIADLEFHNAVVNYLLGHDPAELDRARQIAVRLKDLGTSVGGDVSRELGLDVMGDSYLNLVNGIGPNGGLHRSITDDQVDRCRATLAQCQPGHPKRNYAAGALARALIQRAQGFSDMPLRALPLLAEALDAADVLALEGFEDSADSLRLEAARALDIILQLPPPVEMPEPQDDAVQESTEPADPIADAMRRLRHLPRPNGDQAQVDAAAIAPVYHAHLEMDRATHAMKGTDPRFRVALSHLDAAVGILSRITDRGSDQQSAEHGLMSFDGVLRTTIAAVLLVIGLRDDRGHMRVPGFDLTALPRAALAHARPATGPDVDRALEVLERGRGLLLSRRIETRADLTALRTAYPELAGEFEQLAERITAPAGRVPERTRFEALEASRSLDDLVERIRGLPGFDSFLHPLTAGQLRGLASHGPVVLLLESKSLCQAVVVTEQSITAFLLDVESHELAKQARQLRDAIQAINARGRFRPSPAELMDAAATLQRCLSWTWHSIARPVLDHLGIAAPVSEGGDWPRIWWVPTGAFNVLPLHAAQCTIADCGLQGCGAALEAVVSSYVPGFQVLAHARRQAAQRERRADTPSDGALVVAVSDDELPGVEAAARYAAEVLEAPAPLVGAAATRAAVLDALEGVRWAHFGCHASADPAEPSGAWLDLPAGERLSIVEICRARPAAARLAFVTACGTARTSDRLSDEAIHIASAFLLAGFPAAVGTLWEIDSVHAEQVTRTFYQHSMGRSDGPDDSAHALHRAVRELRRRLPGQPHHWAAYVHAGA